MLVLCKIDETWVSNNYFHNISIILKILFLLNNKKIIIFDLNLHKKFWVLVRGMDRDKTIWLEGKVYQTAR